MAERVLVKVVSGDKRYRNRAFRSVPLEVNGTYLTGQHIDPYDISTKGNLTADQMRGLKPLTEEQLRKFGYVINPDIPVPIRHLREYDITIGPDGLPINHKDYWEFQYLKYQPVVAKDKDSYNITNHRFYIEDKEAEASKRVTKREMMYKALEAVRKDMSLERLTDIAILLNYNVPAFKVNAEKVSRTILEDKIYETCEQFPEDVLKCFNEEAELDLYILKLASKGILTRKAQDFFDGSTFIGRGLEGVKDYMSKSSNEATVSKWSSLLKGDVIINNKANKNTDIEDKLLNDGYIAIISRDKSKLAYVYMQLEKLGSSKVKLLKDAEEKAIIIEKEDDIGEDIPTLQVLKMEAGRLKIPKEEWEHLSREELYELNQKYKSNK